MSLSLLANIPNRKFEKSDIGFKAFAKFGIIIESYRILEYLVEKSGFDFFRVSSYHLDYDWYAVQKDGVRIAVAVSQGASMAVDLAERYRDSGAEIIVRIGTAGKLTGTSKIGDVVIPFAAIRDEGTSKFYQSILAPALCDVPISILLSERLQNKKLNVHNGIIWSTDGRWRETDELISQRISDGALATDMESAALYSFGQFHKLTTSSISVISDEINHGDNTELRGLSDENFWFETVLPTLNQVFVSVIEQITS